jgi:hypothetical protein
LARALAATVRKSFLTKGVGMSSTDPAWLLAEPTPEHLHSLADRRERHAARLRHEAADALERAAEHERRAADLRQQAQAVTAGAPA